MYIGQRPDGVGQRDTALAIVIIIMTIPDPLTSPIIIFYIIKCTGSNLTTTTPSAVDETESYFILRF